MAFTDDQAHDNIFAKDEEEARFLYYPAANFDKHSQSPSGGPGVSMNSSVSAKFFEAESQVALQPTFISATEMASLNLNLSGMSAQQLPEEQKVQCNMGGYGFPPTHAGYTASAIPSENRNIPAPQNRFGDYFMPDNVDQWPLHAIMAGPSDVDLGPPPMPLPSPRPEVWTTPQENHLKESKRNGKTYPEIRRSMWMIFGIDRSVNVLSKRYRMMLERDAKDNVITNFLNRALPNLMHCLEDEVNRVDPALMDEELLRDVHAKLRRTFPKYVRSLALEKNGQ